MGVEKFEYDGTTLPSTADNVEADGAVLSEIQADGALYWQRDTGAAALDVVMPSSIGVVSLALSPNDALATLRFRADGTITADKKDANGNLTTNNYIADWVSDPNDVGFNGADYQITAVLNSGDTPSGSALASALGLGSDRAWTLEETVAGNSKQANLTFTVEEIATPANTDSCTGTINVSKEN